jgi:hypothetical protein
MAPSLGRGGNTIQYLRQTLHISPLVATILDTASVLLERISAKFSVTHGLDKLIGQYVRPLRLK